jgi:hypothetical protein
MLTTRLDLTEFHRKVEASRSALRQDLALATRKAADAGVQAAKHGNFKDRTGQLRSTIYTKTAGWSGNVFWMLMHAPKEYAHFVDLGTKPHDIPTDHRPPGKPLHFYWEKRGVWFTGYRVHHPGTKPRMFFAGAIVIMIDRLYQELEKGFINLRSVWR